LALAETPILNEGIFTPARYLSTSASSADISLIVRRSMTAD